VSILSRVIHGSVDFTFEHVVLAGISFLTGQFTRRALTTHSLKTVPGSNFATRRVLIQKRPLYLRSVHVPQESSFIPLSDRGQQRDVEYVVQVHDAKRAKRHFDLRIVIDGKSVSWAIPMKGKRAGALRFPKGREKWMAIRQPDHIVEHNDFEGVIPDGQKGAGRVRIWARGTGDLHKIEDGHVHFEIFSGPAKGRYVLVHTKGKQGLIISKKPEAVDVWTKPSYTKKEAELLSSLEDGQHVAERKVDGASVELRIGKRESHLPTEVRTFSHRVSRRTGTLIEHTGRLDLAHEGDPDGLSGTRLRAEVWHPRGVNFLSGTLNSDVDRARALQRRAGPIRFEVFDITHWKGQDVRHLPYSERRALYEQAVAELGSPYVHPVRQTKSNFSGFYEQQVGLKGVPTDGIVVKDLGAAYDERPWIKVKPSDTVDCVVVGLSEGQGRLAGSLGAFTCQTPEGTRVQVGSGLSDWERAWIWDHRDQMAGETARVSFHVRSGERTDSGPRFDSWHPDKSEAALKMYADTMGTSPYVATPR
jgi:bifunctional non-homologous end joining protein LigD